MDIINRIKDLREDEDLTQEAIAKKLGYHTTTYKRWEENIHSIKLRDATNIADYYNVSLDYIAGRTNIKKATEKNILPKDESKLLNDFRELSERRKGKIELLMQQLIQEQEDEKIITKETKSG